MISMIYPWFNMIQSMFPQDPTDNSRALFASPWHQPHARISCLSRKHQSISVWMVKQWYPLTPIRPVHAPKSFFVFQGVSFFSWWKIVQRFICHCFPKLIQWQREFCHILPYSQNGTRFEIPNGIVLEPRRKMLPRCFPASPDTIGSYIAAILQLGSSA